MRICVITDNEHLYHQFRKIIANYDDIFIFDFYFSSFNKNLKQKYANDLSYKPIQLKKTEKTFWNKYDLFLSLHSKQLFPDELVMNYRCINIHPGLNPYNRGWYPQAFSIVNKQPVGVTIHEMDSELDHGPIIVQREVKIFESDTSIDIYKRIQNLEIEMLQEYLPQILSGDYNVKYSESEGNVNYQSDFNKLCQLNLDEKGTFRHFLDILRATTFPPYKNAYFVDEKGEKVWVSINIDKDE